MSVQSDKLNAASCETTLGKTLRRPYSGRQLPFFAVAVMRVDSVLSITKDGFDHRKKRDGTDLLVITPTAAAVGVTIIYLGDNSVMLIIYTHVIYALSNFLCHLSVLYSLSSLA